MESFLNLVKRTRSIRRFDEKHRLSKDDLLNLTEHARLGASARNQQSLKYMLIHTGTGCGKVFPHLKWAGFLKDWDAPAEGERPTGYIIVLHDKRIAENHYCDEGIAMQNILLAATFEGLGGCMIAAIDRPALRKVLGIDDAFKILNVVALGKPAEQVQLEAMKDGDYEYWRDENSIHHVPKRSLNEIVINN